ncbi:MAG: 30S ribosomal protein S5 [Chloroflexi bacterium]|nr:30S ribosomal protein S5 [Chloroflexota bacterium]
MAEERENRSRGRGRGRGRDGERQREQEQEGPSYDERVVDIGRTAKVVKGGRRFSFRAVVVVGDNKGVVGVGVGKSREVPDAVRKGTEQARKAMKHVFISGNTIPHPVTAKYGASQVMLKPATPGTGVIAGGGVRAVLECAGVHDVLTKSLGSSNKLNVVRATLLALSEMKNVEVESKKRGKATGDLLPPWRKNNGSAN